jgi:hypothetical protein
VQWSYDLLDDDEKQLLNRCSVFAGGFDLDTAIAITGDPQAQRARQAETPVTALDRYAVLDRLDALVRKSLVTTDQSSGNTRYGLLETIRQFAEDQHAATGASDHVRTTHARYYAERCAEMLDVWNGPRQRDSYDWLDLELDNLRSAFRWATDRRDLDTASTVAITTTFIGYFTQQYEPITWVEELLEAARASDHPSLAALTVMACLCANTGRIDDAVRHSDAALLLVDDPRYDPPPFDCIGYWMAQARSYTGQPDMIVDFAQRDIERTGDALVLARSCVVYGLTISGRGDEATAIAGDVVAAAEATTNPGQLAMALSCYGFALRRTDPVRAMKALRRGLDIAVGSGNRFWTNVCAAWLASLEADHGDPRSALDLFSQSIKGYHDAGSIHQNTDPMAGLAVVFDRIGHHEAAAVLAGYTKNTLNYYAEMGGVADHLRGVLGPDRYEALTHQGATMPAADAVRYALAEIDLARGEL